MAILLHLAGALGYFALALIFYGRYLARDSAPPRRWEWAILLPLLAHAESLRRDSSFDVAAAASFFLLSAVAAQWISSRIQKGESQLFAAPLYVLLLPLAAVGVLLPLATGESPPREFAPSPIFAVHFFLATLSYACSLLAFLQLGLIRLAERRIERAAPPRWVLIPLLARENSCFRALAASFILLTLTLATGVVASLGEGGAAFALNHKNLFAALTWLVFGGLLGGRRLYGWRGRTAFNWTMAGFVFLVLSYLGTQAVLQLILHRPA